MKIHWKAKVPDNKTGGERTHKIKEGEDKTVYRTGVAERHCSDCLDFVYSAREKDEAGKPKFLGVRLSPTYVKAGWELIEPKSLPQPQ